MASIEGPIRFSTFNASLNRGAEGQLITDLSTPDNAQAKAVAEIIQRNNPDVVLINEFDFEPNQRAAKLFQENYLSVSQNGVEPVNYQYRYVAPSNTGVASGFDLDNNGSVVTTPGELGYGNDALGFGDFPGQFGMALYSKYVIDTENIRTFQNFLWKDMPGALLPDDPNTPEPNDWYSPEELNAFRLSSKSHWDIPMKVNGETIHVLASHPTPPVFDDPPTFPAGVDFNGRRNHDEIRFWADYITPGKGSYIYDDAGNFGGLAVDSRFVIMGDQNADPFDGDSTDDAILQLLDNPLINTSVTPDSVGGPDAADRQDGANQTHEGDPAFDTADFLDTPGPGNLRADYVLPSQNLAIADAAVFWPTDEDPLFPLVGEFPFPSSDHRLVRADVVIPDVSRNTVGDVDFLGEVTFDTGFTFGNTLVGGLSGITYDRFNNLYYSISDDRSQFDPARFYTLNIDLSDSALNSGDIAFTGVTTLTDANGNPFAPLSLDPEGIALTNRGSLFISSEGEVDPVAGRVTNPFVNQFSLQGQQFQALPVPDKFLPTADGSSGIRNNLAFESLTLSPDGRFLFTAIENALIQDGPTADLENGSPSRIVQYNLLTGQPEQEFVYFTDPVATESVPPGQFQTNGLVELLALDNTGTLLGLERSFSVGAGNSIKLYQVQTQGALDVSSIDGFDGLEIDSPVKKQLLLDFADLDLPLDNIEGVTFGPTLPDGRQSLIVVSDNNFNVGNPNDPNDNQFTQFLAFALDIDTIPAVTPTVETPQVIDDDENLPTGTIAGDADDPAIYVHPTDSSKSLVISSLKDGGLATYNLKGQLVQSILPADFGEIRYNNVDLVYGFNLGGQSIDLAVASDRENDTLAIFQIDPTTRQLTDITADNITESIFGVDDGEQTAYGLATYTSPVTGTPYVFVSQREGNQVAQLELVVNDAGQVDARLVRTLTVPIPAGGELEDAQVEGMVADRELGFLYVGQEKGGIFKFAAEPNGGNSGVLIEAVKPDGSHLEADVEGLTIYYAEDGRGYLLASSQGDSTFATYDRAGNNQFLGSFVVGESGGIDAVEESDGADVINVPLGSQFPSGLVVVQDGANEPQVVAQDDGELENISTNFKFVPWENVANAFPDQLAIAPGSFDPRNPTPQSLINGVASGDTTQTSTVLWTRSTFLGDVTFEYATDPDFNQIIGTVTAEVSNPLRPVKVRVKNLTAGTDYFYRATDAAGATAEGQFHTAAATGTYAGLRFGVSGDWRGELSPYPAIANADQRSLDFFVEHGDTIYADFESPVLPGVDQARTLAEYRAKHSEVYGDRFGQNTWSDLRASTSILATIDDHEVINDFAGGAPAASDPRFNTTGGLINDTQLYRNGLRAFQEYNPLRNKFYGETGDPLTAGERQLYRFNTYGNDAATFVLDARSFRDQELPGIANPTDPAQVGAFLAASFDRSRTLLGQQQLTDLKNDLLQADNNGVIWKFVVVPEPIQNLGVVAASDRFEGYAAERTELLKFVDDNQIDNVVFVAADIHGTLVNNLTYQLGPGQSQIATNAFEITTGSVAFDAPLGPTVIDLALTDPTTRAFYDSLPVANDGDSLVNDKDDFLKQLINAQLTPLGYDTLGLDGSGINATLLQGDYVAAHTYGWTEFDIDPATQQLRLTTYGIEPYTEAELTANPGDVTGRTPTVVNEFVVNPVLSGSNGQKTFAVAPGNGTYTITNFGGVGTGTKPSTAELAEVDTLKFTGEGLTARNLLLTQEGSDLVIGFEGSQNVEVRLQNFDLEDLDNLPQSSGASGGIGNILFDGQNQIQDSFDIANAVQNLAGVFNRNTTTFLNDLDNNTKGQNGSNDVINGQDGDDTIAGLSGADILRGGDGDDFLAGGPGVDQFWIASNGLPQGTDTITDFEVGTDIIGIAGLSGVTAIGDLSITQSGADTLINALNKDLATLTGIQANTLDSSSFVFA